MTHPDEKGAGPMTTEKTCPICKSYHISKNSTSHWGKQSYKCWNCGHQFVENLQWQPKPKETKALVIGSDNDFSRMNLSIKFLLLILFVFVIGLRIFRDSLSYFVSADHIEKITSTIGRNISEIDFSNKQFKELNSIRIARSNSFHETNSYNVKKIPSFMVTGNEPELELIINDSIFQFVDSKYKKYISISLIDLGNNSCCTYAGLNDSVPRYPASVVKLFWIVMLYGMYNSNALERGIPITAKDELKAIHDSDNEAASRILDAITGTNSSKVSSRDINKWISKRMEVNHYFEAAGYKDINLSQKTFPIPYLNMLEPEGNDLEIRELTPDKYKSDSIARNYMTTFQVSRLLYEIATGKSINNDSSFDMKNLMRHDQSREAWENIPYNAIQGFFGESLPEDVNLYTKVGYTQSFGRQEAAIIESKDGQVRYILVMFANNPAFSDSNSKVFPQVSKFIYESMLDRSRRFQ